MFYLFLINSIFEKITSIFLCFRKVCFITPLLVLELSQVNFRNLLKSWANIGNLRKTSSEVPSSS